MHQSIIAVPIPHPPPPLHARTMMHDGVMDLLPCLKGNVLK